MTKKDKQHFFNEDVFHLLGKELWRRYYLKGNFGKSVGLGLFSEADVEPLRRLMGITPLVWENKKSLSVSQFEIALKNSVFTWNLSDFVKFTQNRPLILKSDEVAKVEQAFQAYLTGLRRINPLFLDLLSENEIRAWFLNEPADLTAFRQVSQALTNLPTDYQRMPLFAYQQTSDAHAFDENRAGGRLLLQVLAALSQQENSTEPLAMAEEKNRLLSEFFLLRDDVMNFVALRGLVAVKNEKENDMWRQASLLDCSWNVPLKEVLSMDKIKAATGNNVLVVENSGVYSILLELLPGVPMICSSGQFTYAVWVLLRKLVASDSQLYYCGDLDPEGLLMAQRLLKFFPQNAQTVTMDLESYLKVGTPSQLSEQRLKKLTKLNNHELKKVADSMLKNNLIAFQEGLIDDVVHEVKGLF